MTGCGLDRELRGKFFIRLLCRGTRGPRVLARPGGQLGIARIGCSAADGGRSRRSMHAGASAWAGAWTRREQQC